MGILGKKYDPSIRYVNLILLINKRTGKCHFEILCEDEIFKNDRSLIDEKKYWWEKFEILGGIPEEIRFSLNEMSVEEAKENLYKKMMDDFGDDEEYDFIFRHLVNWEE